jgi:hypothetical protein
MKGIYAYWAIRILLSVGLMFLLLAGAIYSAGGPSEALDDNDENGPILVHAILGTTLGALWDMVVVSAISSYIVYGSVHLVVPPLYEPPRDIFTDASLTAYRGP